MTRKKFLILIAVMLLSFTACASAAAKKKIDLGEGYNAPSGFKSILITSSDGTAIQNAVENIKAGGTILLSGDFKLQKTINIKKNLTIRGVGNTVLTYSNSSAPDRVIRCQGDINLQNLIITGGASTNGAGVKVDGGKVNIISCDIHGNKGLAGGGLHSQADTLTLTSCDIRDNHATMAGGGMTVLGGTITINNCIFTSNDAALYGGGLGSAGGNITLDSSKFNHNSAQNGGGVAIILASKLTARSCDISHNIKTADKDFLDNPTYSNVFWDSTSTHTFDAYTESSVNN